MVTPEEVRAHDAAARVAGPVRRWQQVIPFGQPGLLVVRGLTKTRGLARLRIGCVLGDPALLERLRAAQPLWAVSAPALAAARSCSWPAATATSDAFAHSLREALNGELT